MVHFCFSEDLFLPEAHKFLEGPGLFLVQGIVQLAFVARHHCDELGVQLA